MLLFMALLIVALILIAHYPDTDTVLAALLIAALCLLLWPVIVWDKRRFRT